MNLKACKNSRLSRSISNMRLLRANVLKGLRAEITCLLEQALIAVIVLLLPGSTYLRGLRLLTYSHALFVDLSEPSRHIQQKWPGRFNEKILLRQLALHRFVDLADYYLSLSRSKAWFEQHVQIKGSLPKTAEKNIMFCTFHYGQGFWALPYFRNAGFPLSWLHLAPPAQALWGTKFAAWIGRRRINHVQRLAGAKSIPVGGSILSMRHRLIDEKLPVMVMPDVPPSPTQQCLGITLIEQPAKLPVGALKLAIEGGCSIFIYTMVLDQQSGKRLLVLHPLLSGLTLEELVDQLADALNKAIEKDPAAWHLWGCYEAFLKIQTDASAN